LSTLQTRKKKEKENPTDREKEREREPYRQGERKRKEVIDGSMYKMSPFYIPISMKASCFKLAFWQLNIMLWQTLSG